MLAWAAPSPPNPTPRAETNHEQDVGSFGRCRSPARSPAAHRPGRRRACRAAGAELVVLRPFGKFDRAQLQRGYKIYKEVCANCHSASLLKFRNLSQPGGPEFTPGQVTALAATYQIKDGPNEAGEMFERPGRPADAFPSPFPNEQAARAANGGAYPPDMSVLAKARTYERGFPRFIFDIFTQYQEQGPDYIAALLTGTRTRRRRVSPCSRASTTTPICPVT